MSDTAAIERLREALAKSSGAAGRPGRASAEEILALMGGEGTSAEVERLVERALTEGETEELLRLLPEIERAVDDALGRGEARAAAPGGPRRRRRTWVFGGLAAAAAALVVGFVLIGPALERTRVPAEYREGDAPAIRALVERGAPLPREAFELSWSAGPEGTLYRVQVAGASLRVLHESALLESSSYTVPEDALAGLDSGDAVLWRVEATLPDARRVSSGTFRASVR